MFLAKLEGKAGPPGVNVPDGRLESCELTKEDHTFSKPVLSIEKQVYLVHGLQSRVIGEFKQLFVLGMENRSARP